MQAARADARAWTTPGVLCLLDAGLRFGEVRGLQWRDAAWGDANGRGRTCGSSGTPPPGVSTPNLPKSGRSREVELSRRLRAALLERWVAEGQPTGDAFVFPALDESNFRRREWARVCGKKSARIGERRMKDLRDTYASQLLTCSVSLGYVSAQLGHSDVAVTAQHSARWAGGNEYREPFRLEPGEVPADFLARLTDGRERTETAQIGG